jgi:hypothetical protein
MAKLVDVSIFDWDKYSPDDLVQKDDSFQLGAALLPALVKRGRATTCGAPLLQQVRQSARPPSKPATSVVDLSSFQPPCSRSLASIAADYAAPKIYAGHATGSGRRSAGDGPVASHATDNLSFILSEPPRSFGFCHFFIFDR